MNKTYTPVDVRNFAVVGHASSGKTMLCESMLACAGVLNRLGSIDAGSTVSDFHDDEQERKISIHTSLMHCEWLGKKFNIMEHRYIEIRGEAFNLSNTPIFASPASQTISSSLFGQIRSSQGERSVQLVGKFYF